MPVRKPAAGKDAHPTNRAGEVELGPPSLLRFVMMSQTGASEHLVVRVLDDVRSLRCVSMRPGSVT